MILKVDSQKKNISTKFISINNNNNNSYINNCKLKNIDGYSNNDNDDNNSNNKINNNIKFTPIIDSKLKIPKMNIVIMAVGTRGDITPFCCIGLKLLQDGHRVRVATHTCFKELVLEKGLDFYPLAGDPVKLSEVI